MRKFEIKAKTKTQLINKLRLKMLTMNNLVTQAHNNQMMKNK